jgi:hypothetical protein
VQELLAAEDDEIQERDASCAECDDPPRPGRATFAKTVKNREFSPKTGENEHNWAECAQEVRNFVTDFIEVSKMGLPAFPVEHKIVAGGGPDYIVQCSCGWIFGIDGVYGENLVAHADRAGLLSQCPNCLAIQGQSVDAYWQMMVLVHRAQQLMLGHARLEIDHAIAEAAKFAHQVWRNAQNALLERFKHLAAHAFVEGKRGKTCDCGAEYTQADLMNILSQCIDPVISESSDGPLIKCVPCCRNTVIGPNQDNYLSEQHKAA